MAYPGYPTPYGHAPPQQPMAPMVQQQVPLATPPPPPIAEDADRIEKSANYVARNG